MDKSPRPCRAVLLASIALLFAPPVLGQPVPEIAPPAAVVARDNPNDAGHGVRIEWQPSPTPGILAYEVYRLSWRPEGAGPPLSPADAPDSLWIPVATVPAGSTSYVHEDDERTLGDGPNPEFVPRGSPVHYRVRTLGAGGAQSEFSPVVQAVAKGDWFHWMRVNVLVVFLALTAAMVFFIRRSSGGHRLFIRPIPGLAHIDEAVGRATEMGRPILFIPGTGTAGDIASLAAFTILSRVARRTAEYQTPVLVPVNDPVMMVMAQGTVKEGYLEAGRPDLYRPEDVFYISAMQFPYVAAVNGLMLRRQTATNFYMGVFHAESLLLAEAGAATGAIQISGTDQVAQIPFFVAATDYTLIGEELYAASAYLSQDPKQVGPLKAQDLMKAAIIAIAVLGLLELTFLGSDHLRGLIKAYD